MALFRQSSKSSLSISKIAFIVFTAAAAVAVIARFVVPYLISALSTAVPRVWSFSRFFLAPPYLFITVHLIIVAIWYLSDQKMHKNPNEKASDAGKTLDRNVTPIKTVSAEISLASEAVTPISEAKSAESCVTNESDEKSTVTSRFDDELKEEEERLDLEDTWQTIVMKRSATWERSGEAAVAAEVASERVVRRSVTFRESPTAPTPAEDDDELNQRFEAFIKNHYDQIRSY